MNLVCFCQGVGCYPLALCIVAFVHSLIVCVDVAGAVIFLGGMLKMC